MLLNLAVRTLHSHWVVPNSINPPGGYWQRSLNTLHYTLQTFRGSFTSIYTFFIKSLRCRLNKFPIFLAIDKQFFKDLRRSCLSNSKHWPHGLSWLIHAVLFTKYDSVYYGTSNTACFIFLKFLFSVVYSPPRCLKTLLYTITVWSAAPQTTLSWGAEQFFRIDGG